MAEEKTIVLLDSAWAWLPGSLLALMALGAAAYVVRRVLAHGRPRASTLIWFAVQAALEGTLLALAVNGMVVNDIAAYAGACCVCAFGGLVSLAREQMLAAPERWGIRRPSAVRSAGDALRAAFGAAVPRTVRLVRDAGVLVVCCALSYYAIELPWNDQITAIPAGLVLLELMLVLAAMGSAYFLTLRTGAGPAVVSVAAAVIGIAQHFVIEFKNASLLPSDLLAATTAAAVAGGYTYTLTGGCLVAVGCASACICACSFVSPAPPADARSRWGNLAVSLSLALVPVAALTWLVSAPDYGKDYGISINYWITPTSYKEQGFLPSFVAIAQRLKIQAPEGYSDDQAQSDLEHAAEAYDQTRGASEARQAAEQQYDEVKPTIIAIMNESFADLSAFEGLWVDYAGPVRMKSVPDALQTGLASVSIYGGGTCNSEFEFLTGTSTSFVGAGKIPYSLYRFGKVDTLPRQLKELGYSTTAIHPQLATNWNRKAVYAEMGFDRFCAIDSFPEGSPMLHHGITDAATYDKILECLGQDDGPQFIFDVTMQNHGGYTSWNIPGDKLTNYWYQGDQWTDVQKASLNEYLSCIEASDQDLADFIEKLRQLDRPVVLVFFGDHQPSIASDFESVIYANDQTRLAHHNRLYQTPYLIWANYDVAGNDQMSAWTPTDLSTLAATTLEAAGAPLTQMQKARLSTLASMPIVNLYTYMDAAGVYHPLESTDLEDTAEKTPESEAAADSYALMRELEYLSFAEKVQ